MRLDSSVLDGEVSTSGYVLERKDRNRAGGGVALYVTNSIHLYDCVHLKRNRAANDHRQAMIPKLNPCDPLSGQKNNPKIEPV